MTDTDNTMPNPLEKSATPAFSICVYCGSRSGLDERFAALAEAVGTWIGKHQGQLVYGGGHNGLMGIVADATLAAGGRVIGVIPRALVEKEWAHNGCTELLIVETMHDRKRIMAEYADSFLALPGGIGTMEEFFEVWTWRQLGYHDKPIGLLNSGGYYDSLLVFLQSAVTAGFMDQSLMALIQSSSDEDFLLSNLIEASKRSNIRQDLAQI
ncbi:Cytokinin riboside 5'-monophosphate phosphoribohydrolase [Polaromonas vacuolata]|uniref:Cytokinin riboside 5'-monophosphate phosphoribohydrolase n=1 Tax=Polaromonas vacuolata TaxID=37448 RepID=A0A6H2HAC9_9BURK|nr:TIGR00730 family Rossman fold protein [Polaromonas vacuolata]QJC56780.1 Cytokinin riboside 5'-monophosphate phosphoribohydrolase [Polaromonas vacuolata]